LFQKEIYKPSLQNYKKKVDDTTTTDNKNLEQLIKSRIEKPQKNDHIEKMTITEILRCMGIDKPLKSELNQTAKILSEMNITAQKSNGITKRLVKLLKPKN